MKSILLAASAIAFGALSAQAADLPVYTKAPVPVVAPFSWSGFYVGGDVGYIWGRSNVHDVNGYNGPPDFSYGPDGFTGNGHIGYNWQSSIYVFGLEVEGGYLGLKGSRQYPPFVGVRTPADSVASVGEGAYVAVTGRVGVVVGGNWLIYGKGGYAATDVKTTYTDTDPTGTVLTNVTSNRRDGWTAGAGAEWAFTNNWTARLEYAHYGFGTATSSGIGGGGTVYNFDQSLRADSVRVGLNYKFGTWAY